MRKLKALTHPIQIILGPLEKNTSLLYCSKILNICAIKLSVGCYS